MSSSDLLAACDIGTTTLALSLLDASGSRIARVGALNPQRRYGADLVSRLEAGCRSDEARVEMARLLREEMLRMLQEACGAAGSDLGSLSLVGVAGNPAIEHLFLGLPLQSIAFPPHRPLFREGRYVEAAALGWPGAASVYLFPLPGGYVGGDLVAVLAGLPPLPEPTLVVDVGTNTEIALLTDESVVATSAAAGPAFEGGGMSCGMAAGEGAVTSVALEGERLRLASVGAPVGLCGSAVIEAIAALRDAEVIAVDGRIRGPREVPTSLGSRVREGEKGNDFVLYRDAAREIMLTQEDVRSVQLAKGAIRAGIEVLLERSGVAAEEVAQVVVTGSFGLSLPAAVLKSVGIIPGKMVEITGFVEEGALRGVERALASRTFEGIENLAQRVKVIPLSGTPSFRRHFLAHIDFPD